jgi:hypothetical protein
MTTTSTTSTEETVAQYRGVIIIEWPPGTGKGPYSAIVARLMSITDAMTGKPIRTCVHAEIHVAMDALVTAELTLFTDEDGEPLFDSEPLLRDGEVVTGVFPFLVAEMRVPPGPALSDSDAAAVAAVFIEATISPSEVRTLPAAEGDRGQLFGRDHNALTASRITTITTTENQHHG